MAGRSLRVNGDAGRSASFGEGWPAAATCKQAKVEAQRRLQAASTRRDDGGGPPWGDRATVETARPARAAAGRCTGRRGASASAATRGLLRQGGSETVRVCAPQPTLPPGHGWFDHSLLFFTNLTIHWRTYPDPASRVSSYTLLSCVYT